MAYDLTLTESLWDVFVRKKNTVLIITTKAEKKTELYAGVAICMFDDVMIRFFKIEKKKITNMLHNWRILFIRILEVKQVCAYGS